MESTFGENNEKRIEWDIRKPWLTLDPWQKEYIETDGNCFLLCGRQVGKSTAASIKFGKRAIDKPNQTILMIALTERQAYELFFKTLMYITAIEPKMLCKGKKKPTRHTIDLINGSKIMCYAAGETGEGIRGYTCTSLVVDEAAGCSRELFIAVSPMLSVTGGSMDLLSTPRGKEGYFYESSLRNDFKKFYVSAEDCPRHKKEFLDAEKSRMSSLEYAQEYLAVFLDELRRVFSDELIKRACILKRPEGIYAGRDYYLGCDLARMGEDEGTYEIIRKVNRKLWYHVENIITTKKLTTETEDKIIELEKLYKFKEIDIDAGAGTLGVSVFDHLLNNSLTMHKIVAINNRARSVDMEDKSKIKLMKEDLYNNMVGMMERGELYLLDDDEIKASLASVQYEYVQKANRKTTLRIFASYGHVAEGLVRAAWAAYMDKRLSLWVR